MNLLQETAKALKNNGHTPEDIIFIGSESSGHSCMWEEFMTLADQEYDNGFGSQEVAFDLIIAFSDGSKMCRDEYDGSEHWDYVKPFKIPKENKIIKRLFVTSTETGSRSLESINEN